MEESETGLEGKVKALHLNAAFLVLKRLIVANLEAAGIGTGTAAPFKISCQICLTLKLQANVI